MSKRLGLLIVMMLFVTMMTGCFGSDDSSTPTPATTSSVVITGTIPALSAPAGAPNKMVNYGTNYEMGVFNAATMTEITGSAVVINGTTYTATVPAGAANVTALIVIKHKTTGKVVYSAIAGNLPTTTQMSAASVTKVTVSGVNLNGESTALATIAKDKGVAAPSIPVSTSVTTMPATVKSTIDTAVGTATITAIRDAVEAVQTVLNASSVPETVKSSILSALDAALSNVLNAFVTAVKDASAVITSAGGATTVTVGGTTINSTTTPAQVTDAVNHVTVVTVTAVTNPSDIAVANGTAVSAIQFPTTVTVTLSNGQTATKNVVWSTTSTPVYNATVSGTYAFTGTVDGTTLKATVKVNVGIIQLKVATPTFTPAAGTFTAAQSVTIATTTEGATIYYTTDGTEPTTSSSVYASAINVAATTTIKAIATKTGMTTSDVASALYTINISLIPVISAERAVKQANGDIVVTWTTNIVTPTAAKLIVSGDIPNPSYPSVLETVSTTTSHSVTIPAAKLAENSAYTKLVISYVIGEDGTTASIAKSAIIEAAQVVADPVFAPVAGTYTTAQSVTITCATEGAEIYYTTDGSAPSSLTTKYTGAIALSTSATTNFKAIAVKTGMTNSNVVSATYVLNISTTKVLTGIALAKATDTVEAETAYTLPTAKASYDDNSVPADVTVSWVEVLAGGTSAVTLPVTKTTAGTYTFQASYTENGVTKTADFVLVVTEKVPVKTLDSLTVTATPAAPTCLVGGTTSVTLKVVANYLTGLVASTAEVTTFTTGSNWANGVFTTTLTAAGTENIVVTYTEGGVTKTANVAVTVSAAAPVVTTVTVSAIALVENTSTQAVVLVKDQNGNTMNATDYTLTYAMSNSVATVSSTGLVTAGVYNVNATTSTLTVTATPKVAGGVAKTGTATVTVSTDTTKPTIVSASALNNKTILVTYSKKVKDSATLQTGALNPANYSLFNAATGTTVALEATSGSPNASKIQATLIFSDTTQTVVKITINSIGASVTTGYVMGGLTDANYRVYVSYVTDIAATPNAIIANSNAPFVGTTTPDSAAPVLQKVEYNKGTGTLTLTFDKAMTNALSAYSKVKFNTTALTTAPTVVSPQPATNKIEMTLAAADKTAIAAMTSEISLTLLAGAVTDTNTTANAEVTMAAVLTTPPALLNAEYDELTNVLSLGFDQVIDITNSNILTTNNFIVKADNMSPTSFSLGTSDNIQTTTNAQTVAVLLSSTNSGYIEAVTSLTNPKVLVAAGAVKNVAGTANLKQDDTTGYPAIALTVKKDTVKPVLQSVTYTESTKRLVFTFNVPVSRTITGSKVKFYTEASASSTANLNAFSPIEVTDNTTLTYDLNVAGSPTTLAGLIKDAQQGSVTAETPANYKAYFLLDAAAFTKAASTLTNDAVTAVSTATTIVHTDDVAPSFNTSYGTNGASVVDKVTVNVQFNEKVDKASAETLANYKIWLMSGQTKVSALTVNAATMTDSTTSKKTVKLITGTQTSSATYLIEIANVKDLANNVISSTDVAKYSVTFTGAGGLLPAPKPLSVEIVDVDNSNSLTANDKIRVKFDRLVKVKTSPTTTTVNAMFDLAGGGAFPTSYTASSKVTIDSADATLVDIVVDATMCDGIAGNPDDIIVGTTTLNVAAATQDYLVDKYSDQAAAAVSAPLTIMSPGSVAAITSATIEDVNNNGQIDDGDKVVITINKDVKKANGVWAISDFTAYSDASDGGTTYDVVANPFSSNGYITTTITGETYGTTVTIIVGKNTAGLTPKMFGSKKAYISFAAASTVKDKWSIGNLVFDETKNTTFVQITPKNTIASPQIQSVQYVDANGSGTVNLGDWLVLKMNVPVYMGATPIAQANWKLGTGTIASNPLTAAVLTSSTEVRLTISATEAIADNLFDFAGAILTDYNLVNFNGNLPVVNGSGVAISASSDTTRPSVVSAAFISANEVKIAFDKAVNVTSVNAAAAGKIFVRGNIAAATVDGSDWVGGTAVKMDSTDTTNKTIIVTFDNGDDDGARVNLTANARFNGFDNNVTDGIITVDHKTGLAILASNVIVNPASGKEVAPFGVKADGTLSDGSVLTLKDITADTVAPAALTTEQLKLFAFNNVAGNAVLSSDLTGVEKGVLEVYVGTSTSPTIASATLASATTAAAPKFASGNINVGVKTAGNYVFYRLKDVKGNLSAWVQDGTVPGAPTLPAATTLIQATDGGTLAPAGYVNNAGKAAVKIRPNITLAANEKLSVRVVKGNTITMNAYATAAATPIFGATTNNILYSITEANSGSTTTGAFDFTTNNTGGTAVGEGTDVAVSGQLTNAAGNISAWGTAVNVTYDKTVPTMSMARTGANAATFYFSEAIYGPSSAALVASSISFTDDGSFGAGHIEDLATISHTAGATLATATTTATVTAGISKAGAKTATSIYDAAGNPVAIYSTTSVTATPKLAVVADVGSIARVTGKIGTGTVQYVKADGSGFQPTPAILTVANPNVPGLTAADNYVVEEIVAAKILTATATTLSVTPTAINNAIRITDVATGIVKWAPATAGDLSALPVKMTGTTAFNVNVVSNGGKYIVEEIAAANWLTAAGGAVTIAATTASDVVRVTLVANGAIKYSVAAGTSITDNTAAMNAGITSVTIGAGVEQAVVETVAAAKTITVN